MESRHYDVVVVGTGSAGQAVAMATAEAGRSTAIVDKQTPGGTCALRGCDPKALLIEIAKGVEETRGRLGRGVVGDGLAMDWSAAMQAKRDLIGHRPAAITRKLEQAGVDFIQGVARFGDERTVVVSDGLHLEAEHIVLDCGARPRPLDIPGADLATTSDGFLDLDLLPPRMVAIGGGYIGMEFGCLAAAAGCEVTVVTPGERPLAAFAPDLVERLVADRREHGLQVRSGRRVEGIAGPPEDEPGKTFRALLDDGEAIETELVLHAAGRVPNTADLEAERGGVDLDDSGAVMVDPATLRSMSNHRVFAIGDCSASGRPKLTPVAGREGKVVIHGLLGKPLPPLDGHAVPSVAFTMPNLARVGLLPQEAPEADVVSVDLGDATWMTTRGIAAAGIQLVIDRDADRLLGGHVLGPHAEEVVNTLALAMVAQVPASHFERVLPSYPSFGALVLPKVAP